MEQVYKLVRDVQGFNGSVAKAMHHETCEICDKHGLQFCEYTRVEELS